MEVILIKALQLILALSILMVVHELGHFIFARIFKVRVEKFYLFFNPWFSLFKFKPKGSDTEYGLGWLPLGAYVKLSGMIDESMDKEQMAKDPEPWEFRAKPAFPRLMIMIGGVLFNFLLAMIIYAGIAFHWGDTYLPLKNVKAGMEFSEVAQKMGFRNGDIILALDGKEMERFDLQAVAEGKEITVLRNGQEAKVSIPEDMMMQVISANTWFLKENFPMVIKDVVAGENAAAAGLIANDSIASVNNILTPDLGLVKTQLDRHKGESVDILVYRNGQPMTLPVQVSETGTIGIQVKPVGEIYDLVTEKYNLAQSIPLGIKKGVNGLIGYVKSMKYIFTKEGAQSVGGFVSIGNIFPSQWNWYSFWNLTALLSIMLGFMNLLPIPALDGGHVLFLLYEVVVRRKPNEKFMEYAQITGMALLFGLIIFANGNDLYKLFFK